LPKMADGTRSVNAQKSMGCMCTCVARNSSCHVPHRGSSNAAHMEAKFSRFSLAIVRVELGNAMQSFLPKVHFPTALRNH
jgi:hypothetical protein